MWLFTDVARGGDLLAAVNALPKGLCGVVFRHDGVRARGALARMVWQICRIRRLAMVVAGEPLPFAGPGVHLRDGRGRRTAGLRTGSAHGVAALTRAFRNGADIVFLSPAFPTASHPGQPGLGALRWASGAQRHRGAVYALGGVDGWTAKRLPAWVGGAGAIGALLP